MALIHARSAGTLEDARVALRRAIERAPGQLEYSVRLADLYFRAGQFAQAKAILTAVRAGTSDRRLARTVTDRLALIAERERALVSPQQP